MSRGPGNLQQVIIDRVRGAGTASVNRLLWDIALERGAATPSVTESFHSAFRRSVRRLVEEEYLRRSKRRLTDIDELIAFYPYKSQDAGVQAVRRQLLPVVKAYLGWRQVRKFTPADNERHLYRGLPENIRAEAEARWRSVEPALFAALAGDADETREAIFDLIVRGQQLLRGRPVRHRASLTALAGRVLESAGGRVPDSALADLQAIVAIFPQPILARLKLKSDLYEIAHLGRDHGQRVKDDFIEYALRTVPDVIRAMPGFRLKHSERRGSMTFGLPIRDEPSPLVHKLLQRDALAPFEFLSLCQDSREQSVAT